MSSKNVETIRELTTAEIARLKAPILAEQREILNERAEICQRALKGGGSAPTQVFDADERAAREHARHLLAGEAPESLTSPPELTRDKILYRKQRGNEIALKILDSKDIEARAVEAVAWAEENADKWRELCRDIVLTAVRLDALEDSARKLLGQCIDVFAIRLPMANVIGGRSLCETRSVSDLAEAALAAVVITASEIKKSKAVGP